MTRLKMIACSLLVLVAAGLIAYPVFGHCGKCAADAKKIAAQLDQNQMTLAKMVTAAEKHSKGRAISVISDLHDGDKVAVHVYCIAGDPAKIMKCHVNTTDGSVMGMKEVKEFPITKSDHVHEHGDDHPHAPGERPHGDGAHQDKPKRHDSSHHDTASVKTITNQTIEVACGACIYKMPGVSGCPLAIMIDGKPYLVEGATVRTHDYCERKLQAIVTGKLEGHKFSATKFELKP